MVGARSLKGLGALLMRDDRFDLAGADVTAEADEAIISEQLNVSIHGFTPSWM